MKKYSNQKYRNWENSGETLNYISIFTPTYNRDILIHRVYECLLKQTDNRFIWILVNDGSVDNTENISKIILEENKFPILFITKSNGGKHSAFEVAFNETKTEFFMCMDDDDIYSDEAVKTFINEWEHIKQENKYEKIGAIRTLTQKEDGSIVSGINFDISFLGLRKDQTTLESNYINHEYFENWTCYRTSALQSIEIFPKNYWMHDQHNFFLEAIWQGRFARKYQCRYYLITLREYHQDTVVSLTRSTKSKQHYVNMFVNSKMILDEQFDYIKKSPYHFFKMIAIVSILRHKLGISLRELLSNTKSVILKICFVISVPVACLIPNPKIRK